MEIVDEKLESSPQCLICKEVLKEIEQMLNGSVDQVIFCKWRELERKLIVYLQHTIIKVVHDVCYVFPTSHRKKECNKFISEHQDKIIQLLRLSIAPSTICSLCMVCEADMNAVKCITVIFAFQMCSKCFYFSGRA